MNILLPVLVPKPTPHFTLVLMDEVLLQQALDLIAKEKKIQALEKERAELLEKLKSR